MSPVFADNSESEVDADTEEARLSNWNVNIADTIKVRSTKLGENAPVVAVEGLKDHEDHPAEQTAEFKKAQINF